MAYSTLAETILDYAMSEGKRTESAKVNAIHLLAAIRAWNVRKFDELFPDRFLVIQKALSLIPQGADRPEGPDDETDTLLKEISRPPDAWSCAELLLKRPEIGAAEEALQKALETGESSGDGGADAHVPETEKQLLTIGLNTALAAKVAAAVRDSAEDVAGVMASDIANITDRLVGRWSDDEKTAVATVTDIAAFDGKAPAGRSGLLARVLDAADPALARELASAYVSAASWAASLDDNVTQEETAQIDALRLELRGEMTSSSVKANESRLGSFDKAFDGIIGLESVKRELRQRIDYFMVAQRRKARGLPNSGHSMHMAFLGNPGTGKTTVARLFAQVLSEMNLLENKTVIEVDRSGLVGEYIGHTEKKTNEVVDSAMGGVLFIDEAYALADGGMATSGKEFGAVAIDILVKRMEDDRDRLMVIVAGYAGPMREFLARNEGLNSRVPLKLDFPDYSPDELVEVAERFAQSDGFRLNDACRERFHDAATQLTKRENFGNARDIRNVYEGTVRNQFSRVADLGDLATTDELTTLEATDVPELPPPPAAKKIGFR